MIKLVLSGEKRSEYDTPLHNLQHQQGRRPRVVEQPLTWTRHEARNLIGEIAEEKRGVVSELYGASGLSVSLQLLSLR